MSRTVNSEFCSNACHRKAKRWDSRKIIERGTHLEFLLKNEAVSFQVQTEFEKKFSKLEMELKTEKLKREKLEIELHDLKSRLCKYIA